MCINVCKIHMFRKISSVVLLANPCPKNPNSLTCPLRPFITQSFQSPPPQYPFIYLRSKSPRFLTTSKIKHSIFLHLYIVFPQPGIPHPLLHKLKIYLRFCLKYRSWSLLPIFWFKRSGEALWNLYFQQASSPPPQMIQSTLWEILVLWQGRRSGFASQICNLFIMSP